MKSSILQLAKNEVVLYLVFGLATTLVYLLTRVFFFAFLPSIVLVTLLANGCAIAFAFITNDRIVFRQEARGWEGRLLKFLTARLTTLVFDTALAYLLVEAYPQIIGMFVEHKPSMINLIATLLSQVTVIVLNYLLSKLFVFTPTKKRG